jgi:NhaP-type Na+/H+ and K+/H+ antiporter
VAPNPALARAVAKWLALQTLGIVVLCILGGYLAGVNWRAAYLLGPVVGVAALVWCLKAVPEAKDPTTGRLDIVGLILVAVGLVSTLYAVSNAASAGWGSSKVLVPMAVGLVGLAGFAWWEWRCEHRLSPSAPSPIRNCWPVPYRVSDSTSETPSSPSSSRCCGSTSIATRPSR